MKNLIIAGALFLLPLGFAQAASADYFLKIEGVEGESSAAGSQASLTVAGSITIESGAARVGQTVILDASQSADDGAVSRFVWKQTGGPTVSLANAATVKASFVPTQAGTYVFELTTTDTNGRTALERSITVAVTSQTGGGTSGTVTGTEPQKKGNVEFEWKVEEGEKAPAIEPDEIDVADDGEPLTPDFSILLGGGGGGNDEERALGLERARQVIEENAKASDQAIESISLNYEKIQTNVKQTVKLFGFIPLSTSATVEIDADAQVKVKFPWWAFLATDKNAEALGQHVLTTLSNVLKTKHDTVKNAIGNIR